MKTWSDERGSSTLAVTAAVGFSLAVFVLCANVLVLHYLQGVARTAADEGARYGSVTSAACVSAARSVLDQLAGGHLGAGLVAECRMFDGRIRATVSGPIPSLVPVVPDHELHVEATHVVADD